VHTAFAHTTVKRRRLTEEEARLRFEQHAALLAAAQEGAAPPSKRGKQQQQQGGKKEERTFDYAKLDWGALFNHWYEDVQRHGQFRWRIPAIRGMLVELAEREGALVSAKAEFVDLADAAEDMMRFMAGIGQIGEKVFSVLGLARFLQDTATDSQHYNWRRFLNSTVAQRAAAESKPAKAEPSREELEQALKKAEDALVLNQKNASKGGNSKDLWSQLLSEAPKGFAEAMRKASKEQSASSSSGRRESPRGSRGKDREEKEEERKPPKPGKRKRGKGKR
jgi:hypothetical protein